MTDINTAVEDKFLANIDSPSIRDELARSYSVRHDTLDLCYSIRGYEWLPEETMDDVYDTIKCLIECLESALAEIERLRNVMNSKED